MTRRLACAAAVWLALALAACGGDSPERTATPKVTASGTAPPAPPPQRLAYVGDARAALERGAIAVVDFSSRVVVAPTRMDVNREQRLSRLRWLGWGTKRATARGDVRTLICDPTCANGLLEHSRGDLVLSAPKRCGKRRFYTRLSMTYEEDGRTRAPATYLRTPPC